MKTIQKILVFLLIFAYISCTCSSFENITDTSELLNDAFIDNNASVSTCKPGLFLLLKYKMVVINAVMKEFIAT